MPGLRWDGLSPTQCWRQVNMSINTHSQNMQHDWACDICCLLSLINTCKYITKHAYLQNIIVLYEAAVFQYFHLLHLWHLLTAGYDMINLLSIHIDIISCTSYTMIWGQVGTDTIIGSGHGLVPDDTKSWLESMIKCQNISLLKRSNDWLNQWCGDIRQ